MHTLPLPHTVRLGDGRTLRATGSAGSFVTAWLLEPTVNSTCVLAVTASWSARVYAAARETHGWVCPLSYQFPVGRRAAVGHSTAAPRTTCACWCSPTSWCSARLACVFAAPGLARNGIRLGRPPLQRSSGLVVLELLPTESLGRVLALPAALRQGALRGQLPGGDAWRCGADGRAAADDSLLHRRPSGYSLSRLARLEVGARRSPCSTAHRLRRRVCASSFAILLVHAMHPKMLA